MPPEPNIARLAEWIKNFVRQEIEKVVNSCCEHNVLFSLSKGIPQSTPTTRDRARAASKIGGNQLGFAHALTIFIFLIGMELSL